VGTLAGRFTGIGLQGKDAGAVLVDAWLGGMIWSTAAVLGDHLFVGADDDTLNAIDAKTGKLAWSRRLGDCEPVRAPGPEGTRCDVDGGPVVGSQGDLFAGADGIYRVTPAGAVVWHYRGEFGQHVYSTPVLTPDRRVVFGGHDGRITAIDEEDGRLVWRYDIGADVDGSPIVGPDGSVFIGADDGRLYAIRSDGALAWTFATGRDIRSAPVFDSQGKLVFGSFDGALYRLDPATGDLDWVLRTGGAFAASPTLDAAGTIFIGNRQGHLFAVSTAGDVLWRLAFPDDIDAQVTVGPERTLIVGCDDGILRALR